MKNYNHKDNFLSRGYPNPFFTYLNPIMFIIKLRVSQNELNRRNPNYLKERYKAVTSTISITDTVSR